eukprot:scaffold239428_cov24-Tisochrysis_lutea.AAC.1
MEKAYHSKSLFVMKHRDLKNQFGMLSLSLMHAGTRRHGTSAKKAKLPQQACSQAFFTETLCFRALHGQTTSTFSASNFHS